MGCNNGVASHCSHDAGCTAWLAALSYKTHVNTGCTLLSQLSHDTHTSRACLRCESCDNGVSCKLSHHVSLVTVAARLLGSQAQAYMQPVANMWLLSQRYEQQKGEGWQAVMKKHVVFSHQTHARQPCWKTSLMSLDRYEFTIYHVLPVYNTGGEIRGLGAELCSELEWFLFLFFLPSSPVIPNPVTAAVHTMANPIMTQLCVEIKTHVGREEGSYLLELKRGTLCCCVFTGEEWMVLNVHLPIRLYLDGVQRGSCCC